MTTTEDGINEQATTDPVLAAASAEQASADTLAARARNALRATRGGPSPVDPADDVVDTGDTSTGDDAVDAVDTATVADAVDTDTAIDADTEADADLDTATEIDDAAGEDDAADEPAAELPTRRVGATTVCAIIAALALIFVVIAGTVWWTAEHSGSLKAANARDDALLAGRLDIATLNSLDYQHIETGLQNWLSVTTGSIHDQISQAQQSATKTIAAAKMVTTASVLSAAVTSLDTGKGTATVIASVNVTKKPVTGAAVVTRNRYSASMLLVNGTWKVSDLTMVAVQLS